MNVISSLSSCSALLALAATLSSAQAQENALAYRDFGVVQRMRVVCSQKHFGRVQDLIVAVPGGKITDAVVSMLADNKEMQSVVVPYEKLTYDPQSNLLHLGTCLEHDHDFKVFDPATIRIVGRQGGGAGELEGATLISRLARSRVALSDKGEAAAHEATLELTSGHVAFLDVAKGTDRAGDMELHPVPWSVVAFVLDDADEAKTPLLMLPMGAAQLMASPTLIEVIVQDPNYRGLVYKHFKMDRPPFDTEG